MERATTGWDPKCVEPSPNCPRCGSCSTKFCYYNNYSLTQPRYFCKGCRRYWTRGGSLRNVPIGGTCRRSRRIVKPRLAAFHIASNNSNVGYGGSHHISNTSSSLSSMENKNNPNNIDLAQVYASYLNQNPRNSVHFGLHLPGGGFPKVESESTYTFHDGSFKFISKFDQIQENDEVEEKGILQPFMGCDHLMRTTNNFGFMPPLPGGLEELDWPRTTHFGSPKNLMIYGNTTKSKEIFSHVVGQDPPQDRYIGYKELV